MKRTLFPAFALALIVGASCFPLAAAAAEDGPLRRWLQERWLQRQEQDVAPAAIADTGASITQAGDYVFTIRHGGLQRRYRVHVPASYDPAVPAPLLVALHGGGGSMDYQADDTYYGQISKSEQEGFIVAFPNGYSKYASGKLATWNAGNCCGEARDNNIDDAGFIRQAVANLTRQLNVDRRRIHATGMSNGGMMAYRLACEMPDVFTAIAAVAGTDNTRDCKPKQPLSILHIHARDDMNVLFEGGIGPGSRNREAVTDFTSVPATVAKWVKLNGCVGMPSRVLDRQGAYCELYAQCNGSARVGLCVTEGGGHSWPGAKRNHGGQASQAISANNVMWEFFKQR